MMTKMSSEGSEFEDVLKDAQQKKDMQKQIRPLISRDMMPAERLRFSHLWYVGSRLISRTSIQKESQRLLQPISNTRKHWEEVSNFLLPATRPETVTVHW